MAVDCRASLAHLHVRCGLALVGFGLALPLTLLAANFYVALVGAGAVFVCGMVVGYQAARIGQAVAERP